MARKRGGLAGIWDRNKQFITPAAELLAGALFTPAAGAGVGAALRGLDRPGKSGIGFDVGQGIRGGIEGYGVGSLGSAAKTGIQGLLTAGQPAVPSLPPAPSQVSLVGGGPAGVSAANAPMASTPLGTIGAAPPAPSAFTPKPLTSYTLTTGGGMPADEVEAMRASARRAVSGPAMSPSAAPPPAAPAPSAPAPTTPMPKPPMRTGLGMGDMGPSAVQPPVQLGAPAPSAAPFSAPQLSSTTMRDMLAPAAKEQSRFGSAVDWMEKHGKAVDLATAGINRQLGSPEVRAAEERNRISQAQLDLEKQQYEDQIKRQQMIAQLLMPYAQQTFAKYNAPIGR